MSRNTLGDGEEVDLRAYVSILRRRWRWVAGALLGTVVLSLFLSLRQTPQYRASADLLVNLQSGESIVDQGSRLSAADAERQLNNEIQILESGAARAAALEAYDGPLNVGSVTASVASNRSDAIRVSATGSDPDDVAELVNTYVDAYVDLRQSQRVDEILTAGNEIQAQIDRLQTEIDRVNDGAAEAATAAAADPEDDALAAEADRVSSEAQATVAPLQSQQAFYRQQLENLQLTAGLAQSGGTLLLTQALPPTSQTSPKPLRDAIVATILGLMIGVGLAFRRDYFDESVRSVEDVERLSGGEPMLGSIPFVESDDGRLATLRDPNGIAAEAYRGLRTSVRFAGLDRRIKVIQVTSGSLGEGKTTTVANLAVALSQAGQRVVVACCDLRRPRIHEVFGQPLGPGFTDLLLGETSLSQALRRVGDNLYLLAGGSRPPNPSELLGTARTDAVIKALEQEFDYVLLDTTPVLPVTDGIVISRLAHGVVFVVSAQKTTRGQLRQALALLRQAEAPLMGFVLNGVQLGGRDTYRYGYRYDDLDDLDELGGPDGRRRPRRRQAPSSLTSEAGLPTEEARTRGPVVERPPVVTRGDGA
jgi:succinoglycan biosynthesis transport protein ExoP